MWEIIYDHLVIFAYSAGEFTKFLTTRINFGPFEFSPLGLLSLGGLSVYLSIAIFKWVAS